MDNKLHLPFDMMSVTTSTLEANIFYDVLSSIDFLGVFLCTKGHIEANINSKQYAISKGDMFIYMPSLYVHVLNRSDDFCGIAIRTDYDYVVPLMNKVIDIRSQLMLRNSPSFSLPDAQYNYVEQLITSLKNRIEMENNSDIDAMCKNILRELIMSLGATLLYELLNIFFTNYKMEPLDQDRSDIIVQKFLISLYHHYNVQRDVSYYASEQCLSPSYFSAIVKQKTGKTTSQWISDIVIVDAKQFLQYSAISVKEIANRLNFPNQSFFGKYFKQYVGISPKEYRRQCYFEK